MATPCFSDWNALISTEQNGSIYSFLEQITRPPFNNLSFPEIGCSGLSSDRQTNSAHCPPDFVVPSEHFNERKRKSISATSSLKSSETKDEKNENGESSTGQAKKISRDGDFSKEEYVHVRAKRGQATNSHSLAERVRREKISERMRVLQDLVPGCDKITGKAVMLDEIINYVQSLQQQVEFLSMKLAAVHPQLKLDIEQIFSKEVPPPGRSPAIQYHHFHGAGRVQFETPNSATIRQLSSVSQMANEWDEELQNAMKMGYFPHQLVNYTGLNDKDRKIS